MGLQQREMQPGFVNWVVASLEEWPSRYNG